jgi:arginyl-tRNA--protein-N-Asp/Glu arginylyltransferase
LFSDAFARIHSHHEGKVSAPSPPHRLLPGSPPELLVHDAPSTCPYLEGKTARLPLRLPIRALRRGEFDRRLVDGDRRQGLLLYRTHCPDCQACEPIRLSIARFKPNRAQRRVFRKGEAEITTELGLLEPTLEKVRLYNRHKHGRNLSAGEEAIDPDGYRAFLGESCCDSFEIRYRHRGKLIGVAITDRSENALSAVYCYFDPDYGHLSPGTYSILKQVELARRWRLEYVYLGLYIADCDAMAYKGGFLPHDRRLDGVWVEYDRPDGI